MPHYKYMIGGEVESPQIRAIDNNDALQEVKCLFEFQELGGDLEPKVENLLIYNRNIAAWEKA